MARASPHSAHGSKGAASLSKKFCKLADGKASSPPGAAAQIQDLSRRQFRPWRNLKTQRVFSLPAPSPVSAKNQGFFGRIACMETLSSLKNGVYKKRSVPTLCICTARVGNAGMSFSENSGKPKKLGTLIYGPQFRVLSGGSRRLSALPTGLTQRRADGIMFLSNT